MTVATNNFTNRPAYVTRRYLISCMHTLSSCHLSEEENQRIYGKCYNQHGHDYRIELTVTGLIDEKSGLCCDRDKLDDLVHKVLIHKYDKTDLNLFFKSTSGEDLAREFFELLKRELSTQIAPAQVARVRLQETPKNFFTWGDASLFPSNNLLF